jgi:nicotinate-nucleotide pyrophosphorylase (carboxylating)
MPDLNTCSPAEAWAMLEGTGLVDRLIALARDEDLGSTGDVTSAAAVSESRRAAARVVVRETGVLCGLAVWGAVRRHFGPTCEMDAHAGDGQRVTGGTVIATLRGPLRDLLALERTLLNLLGRLGGVSTQTARFVAALPPGSRAAIYDTRKTTPGLRVLEKYAVRCAGGRCHRLGLHDAMLLKDNHLAGVSVGDLPAFVAQAAGRARAAGEVSFVEVEADTLEQFRALTTLPRGTIDIVLLDNMSVPQLAEAVRIRDAACPWLELEASGGVTLGSLPAIAATGVDRISIGALTHRAVWLDVAMEIDEGG